MGSMGSASPVPRANSPAPQTHLPSSANGTTVAQQSQQQQQQQQQQRYRYQAEIQSMMYTFGDIRHPHPSTTLLVEDIVHAQLLDLLVKGTQIALRRGARVIGPEDLLFLIRHDLNRSQRLKEFLSWKDVRKNAKPAGSSGSSANGANVSASAASGANDGMTNGLLMLGQGDDAALVAELEEDAKQFANTDSFVASDPNGSPSSSHQPAPNQSQTSAHFQQPQQHPLARGSAAQSKPAAVQIGPKKRQLGLYWDLEGALLADALPASVLSSLAESEELPSDPANSSKATLRRLRLADLLTQSMSQTEYLDYSECRQASFTYKKSRKFREWLLGGTTRPGSLSLGALAGGAGRELARLSDDTAEILGFLAYEAVQQITETSLAVKYEQELLKARREGKKGTLGLSLTGASGSASNSGSFSTGIAGMFANQRKEGVNMNLSTPSPLSSISTTSTVAASSITSTAKQSTRPDKSPILPQHVEEAYRRLVTHNCEPFLLFKSTSPYRTRRLLI